MINMKRIYVLLTFLIALMPVKVVAHGLEEIPAKPYVICFMNLEKGNAGYKSKYFIIDCERDLTRPFEIIPLCEERFLYIPTQIVIESIKENKPIYMPLDKHYADSVIDEEEDIDIFNIGDFKDTDGLNIEHFVQIQDIKKVWAQSSKAYESLSVYACPVKGHIATSLCEIDGKYYKQCVMLDMPEYYPEFWDTISGMYVKISDFDAIAKILFQFPEYKE